MITKDGFLGFLRNQNYNVFKAYDGEEAIGIFEKQEIHLVLMDVMMQGLTAPVPPLK